MAIIYTNNSSGAIRRARKRKPTKSYLEALAKHIKYLQELGFEVSDTGRIKKNKHNDYNIRRIEQANMQSDNIEMEKLSKEIRPYHMGNGGTKPDNRWKLEISKNFTIVPAYNKGPYMVVSKSDLKTAGKKV